MYHMGANARIAAKFGRYVLGNYSRTPPAFVRGKGSWLWDVEGNRYLDFFPGWAAGAMGHCHPAVVRAIRAQAGRLIMVPNNVMHPWQAELARRLLQAARFRGRVFFCNSGAEANEAAIKLARRYWQVARGKMKTRIVTVRGSFHGRTLGALAATGQSVYHRGFRPMPGGFVHVPLNDLKAAARAIDSRTAAFLIEPILGEGGIQMPSPAYLRGLRALTRKRGALLIFDEVQTGCGRTGDYYAFQGTGVVPDAVTLAKPLAGGLPMGALVVAERFAGGLPPGSHASTFGGSPLVCAAGIAAIKVAAAPATLARVRRMGRVLRAGLERLRARHPERIVEIRGRGLMLGTQLSGPGVELVVRCRALGLLVNCTHGTVIRTMPAITVTEAEIRLACAILDKALSETAPR